MRKLLFITVLSFGLFLSGCDLIPEEYRDQLGDLASDYCEENPDNQVCDLDLTSDELEAYFDDYNDTTLTNQDLADMYFEGVIPEEFSDVRDMRQMYEVTLMFESVTIELDGSFEVTYSEHRSNGDKVVRKRPGRIKYEDNKASIIWDDTIDDDCDMICYEEVKDIDTAGDFYDRFFEDYVDPTISNEEFARIYNQRKFNEEMLQEREADLEGNATITDVTLEMREDGRFDVTYTVQRGNDVIVRKRPGRIQQRADELTVEWDELIDETVE